MIRAKIISRDNYAVFAEIDQTYSTFTAYKIEIFRDNTLRKSHFILVNHNSETLLDKTNRYIAAEMFFSIRRLFQKPMDYK